MKSINKQGPQGNNVLDWRETGRQIMLKAGVDPDKPLEIKSSQPDIRDNRDPEPIGREILARRNGHV
jgi:hypothetical protein